MSSYISFVLLSSIRFLDLDNFLNPVDISPLTFLLLNTFLVNFIFFLTII